MTIKEVIDSMIKEMERVRLEDASQRDELSDEDNSFNDGWYSGMARAVSILAEMEVEV